MRRLAAIALLMMCLPVMALAHPYDESTIILTQPASQEARELAQFLYPYVKAGQARIELPSGTGYDAATEALSLLHREYPELCEMSNRWSISYYTHEPDIAIAVEPQYYHDGSMAQVIAAAQSIAGEAIGTQTERAEQLHDWVCRRTVYDKSGGHTASAYGSIINGYAQCEGYAKALVLLYRMAGIPSGMVTGMSWDDSYVQGSHAWVVACIDGVYTLIDPTADDGIDGTVTHWYYGLTDEQMAADHRVDEGSGVPDCWSTSLNWHGRRGLLVSDMSQMTDILYTFVMNREPVEFRFANALLYKEFTEQFDQIIDSYNASYGWGAGFYGAYRIWRNGFQNGVRMEWQ